MSDGPHKTLQMRPGWRRFAKFADNVACTLDEVASAAGPALGQDWHNEVPESVAACICEVLGDGQQTLFNDQKLHQLQALKPRTAGREFGELFVECATQIAMSGDSGPDAVVDAAANALSIWAARHARHVEEHYLRESNARRALNVRSRLESAFGSISYAGLARQLLKMDAAPAPRSVPKMTGLDEGVRL